MKEEKKHKTLSYRRANFFGEKGGLSPLEAYLIEAHEKRPGIALRTFANPGQPVIECRNYHHVDNLGAFLHLASYNPGEPASIIRQLRGAAEGDIDITPPPDGSEFMDGDLMVLVAGNHVLLCATNLHEKKAERYMVNIIEAAGLEREGSKFGLSKVGNVDKLKLLQRQGVKSISLDVGLYEATVDHLERKTVTSQLGGGLMDQVKALIQKDRPDIDIDKAENLIAHIVLKYDSRVKGKPLGREALQGMARQIIDEGEDGFMIETLGGEKIRHEQITVRKTVTLPRHGKSVFRQDAWRALEEYYYELQAGGLLEQ